MVSTRVTKSIFTRDALISAAILVVSLAGTNLHSQDKKPYQAGTIVGVKQHQGKQDNAEAAKAESDEAQQYDISIRVGSKIYTVLYTPPPGQNYPELGLGMDRTVLVEGDTMKVNDLLGRTRSMPILSSKDAVVKTTN